MSQLAASVRMRAEASENLAPFLLVPEPKPLRGVARLAITPWLAKHVLRLGIPVVLGMLTQTAINILDTVMVGRLPETLANPGQAAIGLSLPLMWLVGGFLSAVWVGTQAITSRRAGEGNDDLAGRALTNSLVIASTAGLSFTALAYVFAPRLIGVLYEGAPFASMGVTYLQTRLLGVPAMVGTFSYKSFFDGIGRTKVFMTAAVIMNLLNVALNYLLIYGSDTLGIPQLGVSGAALASVISAYCGLLMLIAWSFRPFYLRRYRYYTLRKVNLWVLKEIVRLSLPNGLATVVVMVGFVAFYWVVGQVNHLHDPSGRSLVAAANQVLVSVAMVSFMSSLAFGSATAAMVSQTLGAARPGLGARYGWEAAKLWGYGMWAYGAVMFLFPEPILALATRDPDVIALARDPVRLLAVLQGIVAFATVFAQTLHGVGNAKYVMYVELFLHLLVMAPIAYLFGLVLDQGLMGIYMGPTVYASLLAVAMAWKFARGDWQRIVI